MLRPAGLDGPGAGLAQRATRLSLAEAPRRELLRAVGPGGAPGLELGWTLLTGKVEMQAEILSPWRCVDNHCMMPDDSEDTRHRNRQHLSSSRARSIRWY